MTLKSSSFGIAKSISFRSPLAVFSFVAVLGLLAASVGILKGTFTAIDPGPRGGPPGAGGPLPGLTQQEAQLFAAGQTTIQEIDSVSGTIPNTGLGLGPRFNMNSCAGCHNFPAPGGSSPPVNPLIAVATLNGATNTIPFFITPNGPILRAFLIADTNPPTDTHLFTITGRSDAPGCSLTQTDFNSLKPNLAFHTPLALYGDGLIQNISTSTITTNLAADAAAKQALGIGGHTGGAGGSGRFFWKGQGTGLQTIAAGAYQNEVGVTNMLFPNEDDPTPSCQFNALPEDTGTRRNPPDYQKIANFVTFSAGPTPIPDTPSIANGRSLFSQVGCAFCHTPSLQTTGSSSPALSHKTVALYSDLALHHMGPGLADGLVQGNAAADEFRTGPLWGLGQRIFFLHDGRTTDLTVAISSHVSSGNPSSEANAVVGQYNALSDEQKQDVLNFLRSL
ncbi:MAG: hypothetical protein C5B51_13400 [Terriglobia bacterium]|nr:MAG: hypothetical protein C5B51_13400 [Terriglobia bacterium]